MEAEIYYNRHQLEVDYDMINQFRRELRYITGYPILRADTLWQELSGSYSHRVSSLPVNSTLRQQYSDNIPAIIADIQRNCPSFDVIIRQISNDDVYDNDVIQNVPMSISDFLNSYTSILTIQEMELLLKRMVINLVDVNTPNAPEVLNSLTISLNTVRKHIKNNN